jgi:hypothetical protein
MHTHPYKPLELWAKFIASGVTENFKKNKVLGFSKGSAHEKQKTRNTP